MSRNWVSLCEVSDPPPTTLIREFYSNLFVYSEVKGGHYLTSWIRGQEFTITKQTISEVLRVPLVRKPTYPYTEFPSVDDMMSLLVVDFFLGALNQELILLSLLNLIICI